MADTVTYGIIGFGGIALSRIAKEGFRCNRERFSPAVDIGLKGVTSRTETRRQDAEALGLQWYGSSDELLADDDIDAVFIATNNLTHYYFARQAMEAGKPVILDKPLTASVEDAEALANMAAAKDVNHSNHHMMRYNS